MHWNSCVFHLKLFIKSSSDHYSVDFLGASEFLCLSFKAIYKVII